MYVYLKRILSGVTFRLFIEIMLFLSSLLIFIFLSYMIAGEGEKRFDVLAFQKFDTITSPALTQFMLGVTFFGSILFLLPAFIILIMWFWIFKKNRRLTQDVTAIGITSTAILFSLKAIFQRSRPDDPLLHAVEGFSFPSGHSFLAFTFFGVLIYIIADLKMNHRLKWILGISFFIFASLIAISRIYLKVHFASDVLAGFCLCIVWLTLSFWIMHRIRRNKIIEPVIAEDVNELQSK